jgi:hypothetical protein
MLQNKVLAKRLKDIKGGEFELLDSLPDILEEPNVSAIVKLLLTNNGKMENLIVTKSSLIREKEYPGSVARFLGHCGILKSAAASQPLEFRNPADYYPNEFDFYVRESYEELKAEVDNILSERSDLLTKKRWISD